MKKKQQKVQLALISIGLLLILLTYLYYPNINKSKLQDNQLAEKDSEETPDSAQSTFENVKHSKIKQYFKAKSKFA